MSIPRQLREQVIQRAKGCCEYCQSQQAIILELEIDHIVPESSGGMTILDNLCLACAGCNGHKHAAQTAVDPETGDEVDLFNPRQHKWNAHFRWSKDKTQMRGITAMGRATIERLQVNRDLAVAARKVWVAAGLHPPL